MAIHEPQQHTKSDGNPGAISVEIDLDTAQVDAGEETTTETQATPAPSTLELPAAAPADGRPAWLDPRFKSPEDMAAAYRALETKLGAPAKATETPAKSAPTADAPAPAPAGLTDAELEAYGREVVSTGKLSDASYAALAAKGIPRSLADAHVEGIQLKRERLMADALKPFGGADGYREAATWAVQNLSAAEQAQYNADVNSGDPSRVAYAVNGLKARLDASHGARPQKLVAGRRPGAGGHGGFASFEQQVAAQSDPRYRTDPAFRQEVERMVRESTY